MNKALLTAILLTALTGCTTEAYWTSSDYEQVQEAIKFCTPHGGLATMHVESGMRTKVTCAYNGVTVRVATPGNRR